MRESKYWLPKNRYLELKYFCLQYPDWRRAILEIDSCSTPSLIFSKGSKSDPTADAMLRRERLKACMDAIERAAKLTDESHWRYILEDVTSGKSYSESKWHVDKDLYFETLQHFYHTLSRILQLL